MVDYSEFPIPISKYGNEQGPHAERMGITIQSTTPEDIALASGTLPAEAK